MTCVPPPRGGGLFVALGERSASGFPERFPRPADRLAGEPGGTGDAGQCGDFAGGVGGGLDRPLGAVPTLDQSLALDRQPSKFRQARVMPNRGAGSRRRTGESFEDAVSLRAAGSRSGNRQPVFAVPELRQYLSEAAAFLIRADRHAVARREARNPLERCFGCCGRGWNLAFVQEPAPFFPEDVDDVRAFTAYRLTRGRRVTGDAEQLGRAQQSFGETLDGP